ncbi:MAG: portal protein [Fusobacteriaceae bacterium]
MNIKLTKANEDKVLELKAHIDHHFNKAVDGRSEKVERFQKSWLYYLCKAPAKQESEPSGYIEPVVRRAVETLRPSILNIFTENESKAVSFRPTLLAPPQVAQGIDMMVNHIFLQENEGYNVVERAITEALVTGDTFLKVFTETVVVEEDEVELVNASYEELAPILEMYPDTNVNELMTEKKTGLISGIIVPVRIEDKVRVEHVNFADIFVDGSKEDIKDALYVGHRTKQSIGSLLEEGYDKEKVMVSSRRGMDYEALEMDGLINDGVFSDFDEEWSPSDEMTKEVPVYEHYIYSSIFNKRGKYTPKLLQVKATASDILAITEIDEMPFVHGVVERIPGSFWGLSLFDKFWREQDAMSRLRRVVEANSMFNTYRRYIAVKGAYDRKSLLNNRPGAVIEVDTPEAVQFFPEETLSQSVYETINSMNETIEKTLVSSSGVDVTGSNVSATAAVITQNNAEMKDKSMARILAYTLFKPLFSLIYNAVKVENGLPSRSDFIVDVNTSNDDAMLGSQLVQLSSLFAQLSQAGIPILDPQGMVEMAKTMTGCSDEEIAKYFKVPQPTEQEMMAQQEAVAKQAEMEARQSSLVDAQVQLACAQVAKTEVETAELIKKGEDDRLRSEEESLRAFQKLELQKAELEFEMTNPETNLSVSR